MRRRLSRQQIDALIVRLRALKIPSGLLATAFWQLGWLAPPAWLGSIWTCLPFSLWMGIVAAANGLTSGLALRVFPDFFPLMAFLPMLSALIVLFPGLLSNFVAVRNRIQAWFVLVSLIAGSTAFVCLAVVTTARAMASEDHWTRDLVPFSVRMSFLTGIIWMIGVPVLLSWMRHRYRQKWPSWAELLDEVTTTEAF